MPSAASLAALNQLIGDADIADDGRVIIGSAVTVVAAFAARAVAKMPLPTQIFEPARLLQARVAAQARICVRQN